MNPRVCCWHIVGSIKQVFSHRSRAREHRFEEELEWLRAQGLAVPDASEVSSSQLAANTIQLAIPWPTACPAPPRLCCPALQLLNHAQTGTGIVAAP